MSWKVVTVLLLFFAAFANGLLLGDMFSSSFVIWIICSVLIVGILSAHIMEISARKVIAVILIILVLIPLVFFGTCLLAAGGLSFRNVFTAHPR